MKAPDKKQIAFEMPQVHLDGSLLSKRNGVFGYLSVVPTQIELNFLKKYGMKTNYKNPQ